PGPLAFRYDNQKEFRWEVSHGSHRDNPDPAVWRNDNWAPRTRRRYAPERECDRFSEFVLIAIFYETTMGGTIGAWTDDPAHFREVERDFSPCGFSGSYWFMRPVRYFEGPDILLNPSEDNGYLYAAFRNDAAIEQLSDELRAALENTP